MEISGRAKLLGSWRLIQWQIEEANGSIGYPLGEEAVGQLTYTPDGRVSAQLMRSGQAPLSTKDWRKATVNEKAEAWSGYFGYFGTYAVDEAAHIVHHNIEGSWFPNLVGSTEIRHYQFKGERLILDADTAWGKVHIVWEKVH